MSFTHLTPELALEIYRMGCFPMAESAASPEFQIYETRQRSLLPIRNLHVSRSLRKQILKSEFEIRVDTAFADVIEACGEKNQKRAETWINDPIRKVFTELHHMGHAHSVECWKGEKLFGGLYGLQIGGAFCGESMFSRETGASKIALVHLCARLDAAGFVLLDAQLPNPHLEQFGQYLVSQAEYMKLLEQAKKLSPNFSGVKTNEEDLVKAYISRKEP